MNEEFFDVLDGRGNKTGRIKSRNEVHRDGDWHRAVDIFVVKGGGAGLITTSEHRQR